MGTNELLVEHVSEKPASIESSWTENSGRSVGSRKSKCLLIRADPS
jgi:hypothetical protein